MSQAKRSKQSDNQEYSLVYSTDPIPEKRCSGCHRPVSACVCAPTKFTGKLSPAFRIERKGRGGKTVTVIHKLPAHETLLKDLCAFLKKSLGTGGTFAVQEGAGIIEIQGERIDELKALIERFSR